MKLSVVTTIYRTSGCIVEFHRRCAEVASRMGMDLETIFVNDGSPDDGLEVATALAKRDARVVVVDLARNFGQHLALWEGIEQASGDLVAILDGDLEEDPLWLADFRKTMVDGNCDVVYGFEHAPSRSPFYRAGRRLFYFMLNRLSAVSFPENVITARLMSRRYVNAILRFEERELYLGGLLYAAGFAQTGMEVSKLSRRHTKYTALRLARLFINSVTSFSIRPLMAIFVLGLGLSAVAGFFLMYLVYRKLVYGIAIEGYASVMGAIMLFSGITLFFNGIIAIYVATIFLEVKRRPRVLIRNIVRDGRSLEFTYQPVVSASAADPAGRATDTRAAGPLTR
jgi:putative glycosyltransferase